MGEVVEGFCEGLSEFEVLSLVVADGDLGGLIEQDVGGLEDGIGQQSEMQHALVYLRDGIRVLGRR